MNSTHMAVGREEKTLMRPSHYPFQHPASDASTNATVPVVWLRVNVSSVARNHTGARTAPVPVFAAAMFPLGALGSAFRSGCVSFCSLRSGLGPRPRGWGSPCRGRVLFGSLASRPGWTARVPVALGGSVWLWSAWQPLQAFGFSPWAWSCSACLAACSQYWRAWEVGG